MKVLNKVKGIWKLRNNYGFSIMYNAVLSLAEVGTQTCYARIWIVHT